MGKLNKVERLLYDAAGGSTSRYIFLPTPIKDNKVLVDLGLIKYVNNSKKLAMYCITDQLKNKIEHGGLNA